MMSYNHLPHISPDMITSLKPNQVFVFGSNLAGSHGGGAARQAFEKFGAKWGVGVGPTGQSYAIPTMHGGLSAIQPYVEQFLEYAKANPDKEFLVTRIGCGIAGFTDSQMAPLFKAALAIPNIALPALWWEILTMQYSR